MAKERLDLMVEASTKKLLRDVAKAEGISMSQLVEAMLMEHLSYTDDPSKAMYAVADMLWLMRLHDEYEAAMRAGTIYSFKTYVSLEARGLIPDTDAPIVLYIAEDQGRFKEGDFVLDACVDEYHNDIVSTYDDVLRTVSVRIGWAEGDDGSLEPYDLRIWPKGKTWATNSLFDWGCGAEWHGMATRQPHEEQ